jgi:DNA polymerase-3 subunit alpha
MFTDQFVHLHVHTEYSMLDGAAKIDALFREAQRLGQPALAMTDHGNLFGAAEFYRTSLAYPDVKPIIGMEAYCAPASRSLREPVLWGPEGSSDDVGGSGAHTHVTLLAENVTGLRNLFMLSTRASAEGFYRKPRVDRELLAEHSEGVIATTGCPGGEVSTRLALGQYKEALQAASDFRDIFGRDNYFLELMDHGCDIEQRVRTGLLRLGKEIGLPPLVTNDSHYVTASQVMIHDALLCVQTGATLDTPGRFKFEGSGYYLKSRIEMERYGSREGGLDNTLLVAERVQSYAEVFEPRDLMPRVPLQPGQTEDELLRAAVDTTVKHWWGIGIELVYRQRLEYELNMIAQMGFAGYFLVVADLCDWAKSQGIAKGPGRGSAAGSLVCYLLGITDLDPIVHDLYFERFLNPDRISPPDIDLDFERSRRGEVVGYLSARWGAENVAQVITFGRIETRSALKDAARVLHGSEGFSLATEIIGALPPAVHGMDVSLADLSTFDNPRHDECEEFRQLLLRDPWATEIVDLATGLEGLIRQAGVHACGVVIGNQPLAGLLPLWTRQVDRATITGWDFEDCEGLGLQKLDILGLRTLDVIQKVGIDVSELPLDDPETFELLRSGHTVGVFQLESQGCQRLLRQIQPAVFTDISATLALYRPGPLGTGTPELYAARKSGKEKIVPIHSELAEPLAEILSETYGLFVYQEQIMRAAQEIAGYSLGRADILRKAMGKKKPEVLKAEVEPFFTGVVANGYSASAAEALWDTMLPFAAYGFVRAHAVSYALTAYRTAYLKVHYPAEFMAAQLSSVSGDPDRRAAYLAECRRMGITVLGPDINSSGVGFTVSPVLQ